MSTRIDFSFDPSCPFSWVTSRWLIQTSHERDVQITWRPFSLALKNDELPQDGKTPEHAEQDHLDSLRILRVIAAAAQQGASTIGLYSAFGEAFHLESQKMDDALISSVLKTAGLDAGLGQAADDASWDQFLEKEMNAALDVVGQDVGVPLIVFRPEGQEPQGYFGPVLNQMPSLEEGLAIWDGLEKLAPVQSFYELKRSRPKGPDKSGTANIRM